MSHSNVSLIVGVGVGGAGGAGEEGGRSKVILDNVRKSQPFKRKKRQSGIEPRSVCLPAKHLHYHQDIPNYQPSVFIATGHIRSPAKRLHYHQDTLNYQLNVFITTRTHQITS